MSKTLSTVEQQIKDTVLPWMAENKISQIIVKCSGGGDEGNRFNETICRGNDPVDDEFDDEDQVFDILEQAASELSEWDWINGDGGTADITVNADGTYKINGTLMEYLDVDPVSGSVNDDETDDSEDDDAEANEAEDAEESEEESTKGFSVVQQGGASSEKYLHVSDNQEEAEAFRISCRDEGGYNTSAVFEVPEAVMRLPDADRQEIFSWVKDLIKADLSKP